MRLAYIVVDRHRFNQHYRYLDIDFFFYMRRNIRASEDEIDIYVTMTNG